MPVYACVCICACVRVRVLACMPEISLQRDTCQVSVLVTHITRDSIKTVTHCTSNQDLWFSEPVLVEAFPLFRYTHTHTRARACMHKHVHADGRCEYLCHCVFKHLCANNVMLRLVTTPDGL